MNNSPTLQSLINDVNVDDLYEYAKDADADNTKRAYESDIKHFMAWCSRRKKKPLPAEAETVALYIKHCVQKQRLKLTTIKRRLSAISISHKKYFDKTPTSDWIVKNTLKRLERDYGVPPKGKKPILVEDLKEMVEHCPPTLSGIRDKAILLIGFSGAFRRSELVALTISDLTISEDGLVILIRNSKTDQKNKGQKIAIPYGKSTTTCPVSALLSWLSESKIVDGYLFRGLTRVNYPRQTKMSDKMVALIVKKYTKIIGKKVANFAGHSLRSGFATSSSIAGASESSIQKQTRHKSVMTLRRYIRDGRLFRENAASKLGL